MSQSAGAPSGREAPDQPPERIYRTHYVHSLWVQGVYYLVTGAWPLVSIDTFQAVTGPKTDLWLVRTVGALVLAVAAALLAAALRRRVPAEVGVLAVASAVALGAVDVVYVSGGVLPPVHLLD